MVRDAVLEVGESTRRASISDGAARFDVAGEDAVWASASGERFYDLVRKRYDPMKTVDILKQRPYVKATGAGGCFLRQDLSLRR